MNLWRKVIHQTSALPFASSAWRFVAAGGVSGFIEQNSFKLLCASFVLISYSKIQALSRLSVYHSIPKSEDAFLRAMADEGVTWEFCQAKVAELKKKTRSLSASEHDRFALQIYKEWMHMLGRISVPSSC